MLRIETHAKRQISETETLSLPRLVLPFDLRQKSRLRATLDNGVEAALFLPRGTVLRHGDLLEAEDRTLIRVVAAPEDVLYVTGISPTICCALRTTWGIGMFQSNSERVI